MVATATSEDPYLDQHAWIVGDRELVKQVLTHPKLGKDISLAPGLDAQAGPDSDSDATPEYTRMMIMND